MRVAVTGSATGIGAEACRLLKERGDEVIGFDVAETSANVDRFYNVDLSDPVAIETTLAAVEGRFDALLNIAGVPPRPGNEVLVLAVNFIGLRAFTLGLMDKLNDSSSIVNMSSRAGMAWRDNIDQVKALMGLTPDASIEEFCRHHEINHIRAYNLSKEAVIVWSIAQTESEKTMQIVKDAVASLEKLSSKSDGGSSSSDFKNMFFGDSDDDAHGEVLTKSIEEVSEMSKSFGNVTIGSLIEAEATLEELSDEISDEKNEIEKE